MSKVVDAPGIGVVEFGDDVSDDDIAKALSGKSAPVQDPVNVSPAVSSQEPQVDWNSIREGNKFSSPSFSPSQFGGGMGLNPTLPGNPDSAMTQEIGADTIRGLARANKFVTEDVPHGLAEGFNTIRNAPETIRYNVEKLISKITGQEPEPYNPKKVEDPILNIDTSGPILGGGFEAEHPFVSGAASELGRQILGMINSPEGLGVTTALAASGPEGMATKIIGSYFAGQIGAQVPEAVGNAIEVLKDPNATSEEKGAAVAKAGGPMVLGGWMLKHASKTGAKEGKTNASANSKNAEVYGDMQSLSGEGKGKVPIKEGEPGVQPQTQAPVSEVLSVAGRTPQSEIGRIQNQSASEFQADTKEARKTGLGQTERSYRLAEQLTAEDIPTLQSARESAIAKMKKVMASDMDAAMSEGMKGQFFGEAIKWRQALDEARETGATTREQFAELENKYGVGDSTTKGKGLEESYKRLNPEELSLESSTPLDKASGSPKSVTDQMVTRLDQDPSQQKLQPPVKEFNLDEPISPEQPQSSDQQPTTPKQEVAPVSETVGMGGATPSEFELGQTTPTGIKNAKVDAERKARGLPPAVEPARRSFGKVWDDAMKRIENDPTATDRLIGEIRQKPRALTDQEDAMLLHRQIDIQNEYDKATKALGEAFDEGRMDAVENENARISALSDQLLDIYDVGKKSGTETGRGLNARKMMVYEDFSLAKMELAKRAANGGRPITPTERAEITRINKKITDTQKAFDERTVKTDRELAARDLQEALDEMNGDVAKSRKSGSSTKPAEIPEKVESSKAEIKKKIEAGERNEITSSVQKLARLFVERGITGRDALIDAVHGVLKEFDPEITRRETMDAISGYGDFRQLTKDEISIKLRDLKGQMQQVAKLEDMQSGKPPLKTGMERRTPSTEESRLIRLVNEAKNQFQIPITDEATQLKSSLDTLKSRLKHKTAEWQDRLKRGDFAKKPKRTIKMDAEANRLHFENAKAKEEWHKALMKDRLANRSIPRKIIGGIGEIINTFRAIRTSFDFSAVLRQGGFIAFSHPIRASKSIPAMLKAFMSEQRQHAVNQEILGRKNYPFYQQSKLYLSEHGQKLSQMEEAYMSRWADKIPLVAASQRAYTTFLNKLRADSFDAMANTLSRKSELTPAEGNAIANFINVATGRGSLGMKENALVGLNTVFFAPRYVASRFQLALGQPFYRGSARTRIEIAKEYAKFLAGLGVVYALGKTAGADIETDPRSADFGKMKFGKTRVDPLSGLAQVTTLLSRLITGKTKTQAGRIVPIRGDKVPFGTGNAADVMARFLRSKLSPAVGTIVNVLTGKDVVGQPVTPGSTAKDLLVPMSFDDIYKAMKDQGMPAGAALALLAILGMSVQTYDEKRRR